MRGCREGSPVGCLPFTLRAPPASEGCLQGSDRSDSYLGSRVDVELEQGEQGRGQCGAGLMTE